jgi:hypothetical protein
VKRIAITFLCKLQPPKACDCDRSSSRDRQVHQATSSPLGGRHLTRTRYSQAGSETSRWRRGLVLSGFPPVGGDWNHAFFT